jgi:hypothetical protein
MFKVNLLLLWLKAKDKIDENHSQPSIAWSPQAGTPKISLAIASSRLLRVLVKIIGE